MRNPNALPSQPHRHRFNGVAQLALAVSGPDTNSYGHNRHNPDFVAVEPVRQGGRPSVLTRLASRLPDLYNDLRRPRWRLFALQANRTRRSARVRRIYSPRREAMIRMLQVMTRHADLQTLMVLAPNSRTRQLEPPTLAYLAKCAGLGLKRADRAMADIEAMGLVHVRQRRERDENGNWRSQAAARRLSKLLFLVMGLGDELERQRRRRKALNERREQEAALVDDRSRSGVAIDALHGRRLTKTLKNSLGLDPTRRRSRATDEHYDPSQGRDEKLRRMRELIGRLDPDRRQALG